MILPEALTIFLFGSSGRRNLIRRRMIQMLNMATLFYKIWDKTETRTDTVKTLKHYQNSTETADFIEVEDILAVQGSQLWKNEHLHVLKVSLLLRFDGGSSSGTTSPVLTQVAVVLSSFVPESV